MTFNTYKEKEKNAQLLLWISNLQKTEKKSTRNTKCATYVDRCHVSVEMFLCLVEHWTGKRFRPFRLACHFPPLYYGKKIFVFPLLKRPLKSLLCFLWLFYKGTNVYTSYITARDLTAVNTAKFCQPSSDPPMLRCLHSKKNWELLRSPSQWILEI